MTVKVKVTLKSWKGRTAAKAVQAQLGEGVMLAAEDLARIARNKAKRGKNTFGKPEAVTFVGSSQRVSRLQEQAEEGGVSNQAAARFLGRQVKARIEAGGTPRASRFVLKRTGEKPGQLVVARGFVKGRAQNRHLKDAIEVHGPFVGGSEVSARVVAAVKHAAPIEFGFRHKGGFKKKTGKVTSIAKQPFMRPAKEAIEADYRTGKYFKG